jgi:hypothetical protein
MTVTGAVIVFSRLPFEMAGRSLSFASGVVRKTSRAGEQLAEVGPRLIRSWMRASSAGSTGRGSHLFWLRAVRNSVSSVVSWSMRRRSRDR